MAIESRCPHCQEPVALIARACPHCRNSTFVDLRIDAPVADARTRYRVARALAAAGPGAPSLAAAQAALAAAGGRVLLGALPGIGADCAAILAEHRVAHSLEPGVSQAAASRPRAGGSGTWKIVATLAVVLVAAGAGLARFRRAAVAVGGGPLTGAELARHALASTVAIRCPDSVGAGFFVAPGEVLTNSHVVCPKGQDMVVRLSDGSEGTAEVLQSDDRLDLALLKVAGIDAAPLPLGDAGALSVGDRVMIVGAPKGMEFSVSQGGVSNLDRIHMGVAMIQTDAPINPGNSGGPMLDEEGRVVGVISLKRRDAEGISLALPINYVFDGPQAMLVSPLRVESAGFQRMSERAAAEEGSEVAKLQATGQRPGLMAAGTGTNQTILAEIWWPAPADPGTQAFDFDLVAGGASACALRGEVPAWRRAEAREGGSILQPSVKAWLDRNGFASDIWVGVAVIEFAHCPPDALRRGVVLRMQNADDDAAEIRF